MSTYKTCQEILKTEGIKGVNKVIALASEAAKGEYEGWMYDFDDYISKLIKEQGCNKVKEDLLDFEPTFDYDHRPWPDFSFNRVLDEMGVECWPWVEYSPDRDLFTFRIKYDLIKGSFMVPWDVSNDTRNKAEKLVMDKMCSYLHRRCSNSKCPFYVNRSCKLRTFE